MFPINLGLPRVYRERPFAREFRQAVLDVAGSSLFEFHDGSVTSFSGLLFRWDDLSGNNRHLLSPGSGNNPTVGTSPSLGGRSAVLFDGGARTLTSVAPVSDYRLLHDGTRSAVYVACATSVVTPTRINSIWATTNATGPGVRTRVNSVGATNSFHYGDGGSINYAHSVADAPPQVFINEFGTWDLCRTARVTKVDSWSQTLPSDPGPFSTANPERTLTISAPSAGASFEGEICAIIALSNPSSDQLAEMEALVTSYFLGVSL